MVLKMDELSEVYRKTKTLHHAYAIEGVIEVLPKLIDFFEETLHVAIHANPDVYVVDLDTFTIDDGRMAQRFASTKPLVGERKFLILGFHFITQEAQNALLKVLEDPTPSTHFFIIVPTIESLLPTVRSRVHLLKGIGTRADTSFVDKFLPKAPPERLRLLAGIIEGKDKQQAIEFLNQLEKVLHEKNLIAQVGRGGVNIFEEVRQAREYLHDRSASTKMILEHISFVVPTGGILKSS